jgi:hypothetical protein
MLGIFLFYKPLSQKLYLKNGILRLMWEGTAVGLAAQLLTIPLTLYYFHQFPNYFVLTNLGFMLFALLILGGGIALISLSWIPVFSALIGVILAIVLTYTLKWVHWIDELPGSVAKGFVLHPLLVASLFLAIFLFYVFRQFKSTRYLVIVCLLGFLSQMSYQRLQHLKKREICFFNQKESMVAVKYDQQIFCFYESKPDKFNRVQQVMNGYAKLYPGEIHYYSLIEKNWLIKTEGLRISTKKVKAGLEINVNGTENVVLKWVDGSYRAGSVNLVLMPWIKEDVPGFYSLNKGAVRFEL